MRNFIVSLTLCALLPLAAAAAETKVLSLSGSVDARLTREGEWAPAAANMEIPEGGAIRTGAGGAAVVVMPNKTKVWLKESSTVELDQRQTLSSRLALLYGKIKIRVPHLMRKEKFEVRTPAAVCAVRGTEFTLGTTEDGKMDLQVLFGEVKMKFLVPPERGPSEFSIPQGQGMNIDEKGKATKPQLLTAAVERQALENWNPGLNQEERQKDMQQKENDRAQIKEFAAATNNSEAAVKSFLNVVKESDLEAGRTMNDIHGNVVRVDQRMMRPDDSTIQFMNLVKRPSYADYSFTSIGSANNGFRYNGGAVADRLDLMQTSIRFDKPLPQSIEQWPSFFNDNDVQPLTMSMIMANRTNADEIFVIAEGLRYDATRDEMVDNLTVLTPGRSFADGTALDKHVVLTGIMRDNAGTTSINEAQDMLNALSRLEVRENSLLSVGSSVGNMNTLQYKDAAGNWTAMNSVATTDMVWAMNMSGIANSVSNWDNAGDPTLWQFMADPYAIGNKTPGAAGDYFFLARENYAINNGGQIRQASDFTESSLDPFSMLKEVGAQTIAYVKKSNGQFLSNGNKWSTEAALYADIDNSATGDRFVYASGARPNIDNIFIPDLFIAAVQRVMPALTSMGD